MTDNQTAAESEAVVIDARGLACPLPVLRLRKVLLALSPGAVVELLATDRAALRDVPAFCTATGHELLEVDDTTRDLHFVVRRV